MTKTFLIVLSVLLLLIGCGGKPTDQNVASSLQKHFDNSIKITDLKSTYKSEPEIQGTKFYSTSFTAIIEFIKDWERSNDSSTSFNLKFNKGDKYKIDSGIILFISTPQKEWFGDLKLTDLKKIK